MNILKQVYCNQYYELKPKGKGEAALVNGTLLVSVVLVLYAFAISFILISIFPNLQDIVGDFLQDLFGRGWGKTIGRIIGGVFIISAYFCVKLTLGKKDHFDKIIAEFETLDQDQQKRVSQNGLIFFASSIGFFALSFILFLMG